MRHVSLDSQRQDVALAYLHPSLHDGRYRNLHVVVELKIVRTPSDNKKAAGVEYVPNPDFHPSTTRTRDSIRSIQARRLVVASCGSCGTPPLLERSGIGNRKVLLRAGVTSIVAHVPGSYPEETLDALTSGRLDLKDLLENHDKILGWNGIGVTCKPQPNETDVAAPGPAFQNAWDSDFKTQPNRPLVIMSLFNALLSVPVGLQVGQYMAVSAFSVYPHSRGNMHIICTGLNDPDVVDIEYSPEDDLILEDWLRNNVSTAWNSLGTCKMGVVGARISVHNVENLKIADLSIPP
ncbi:GMC oxidoreductase [Xylaria acuta]|nr:GMC oxidoreductase [Xylaria acuta]